MAKTITQNIPGRAGGQRVATVDITLDNSYPTGGYPMAPAEIGLYDIRQVVFTTRGSGQKAEYNFDTKKIQMFSAIGTEVTAGTNLSAVKLRGRFEGI